MHSGLPLAALGLPLLLALPAAAQNPPEEGPDSIPLVFEREVFHYPEFERRNPFQPLTGDLDGPRYEELRLLGVILSPDPERSVALLGIAGGADGGTAGAYRLRTVDVIGNVRILDIQRGRVRVEVEEFGVREQRTMEVEMVRDPAPQRIFRPREARDPDVPPDTAGAPASSSDEDDPPSPGSDDTVEGGRER